jgi:hypothetical protein
MKADLHSRIVLFSLCALVCACASVPDLAVAQQAKDPGVQIERLIGEVQVGLAKAQKDLADNRIPLLKSVTLNLVAEAQREGGGSIGLFIVTFGKKWQRDLSQEIEVTLKPPSSIHSMKLGKEAPVADQLAAAIVAAGRGVQQARMNEKIPLVASALKVVLSFVVKGDTSGGGKIEIVPVTVELSGKLANSATQKITVLFEDPEKTGE